MVRFPLVVPSTSLGTSTAQTVLNAGKNIIVPQWAKAVTKVRPYLSEVTPTATQSVLATLNVTSTDTGTLPAIGNFEVFAEPLGSVLGITAIQLNGQGQNTAAYGWNFRVNPSMQLTFNGQAQTVNAAAPRMGATAWFDTGGPDPSLGGQWHYLSTSVLQGGGPTSTGTTAAAVSGGTMSIAGPGKITVLSLYGVVVNTQIAPSDLTDGYYYISAPECAYGQPQWNIEPLNGILGATGFVQSLISKIEGLSIPWTTPSTISTFINLGVAPATTGKFAHCIGYQ